MGCEVVFLACFRVCVELFLYGMRIVFWIDAVSRCPNVVVITHSRVRTRISSFGGATDVGFVVVMVAGAVKVCLGMCIVLSLDGSRREFWVGAVAQCRRLLLIPVYIRVSSGLVVGPQVLKSLLWSCLQRQ